MTDGRLEGHSVLLVRTPGASDALVRQTRAALLGANASLTGELTVTRSYLDPAQAAAPLEDLALRLVPPNMTFARRRRRRSSGSGRCWPARPSRRSRPTSRTRTVPR